MLSTIAARRIKIDMGGEKFTNLYIALASRTSVFAKSTTAKIGKDVLKAAGMSFFLAPDEATPQAFVHMLSYALPENWNELEPQEKEEELVRLAFAAQRGWFYEEFGQKISMMMRENSYMSEFRSIFRRFDDDEEKYEYKAMNRQDLVYFPYLALLANTTPADLEPYAKHKGPLWRDGFWARFAFLTPPLNAERSKARFPVGKRVVPESLVKPLVQWHRRLGFTIPTVTETETKTGKTRSKLHYTPPNVHICNLPNQIIDAYYEYGDSLTDIAIQCPEFDDIGGNYSRLPEKAIRVAVLLSSLENNGSIELKHWERAKQIAEVWRRNLHNLYDQVIGKAEESKLEQVEQKILGLIAEKGPITKREAYQNIRGLDSNQASILIDTMVKAGLLQPMKGGKTERYAFSVDSVDV